MHYYQFNIGDYARRTAHLTPIENLAYRLLLERYYLTEKPLELDIKKLSRLIGLRDNLEEVEQVLDDFFNKTDEGWKNNRCEEEIAKYHSKSSASRANGKLGGRPKNQEKTQQVISENQDETEQKGNQEPITNNQEPRTNNKTLSSKPSASTCPHLKIIELYHEILPELPRVIPDMWKGARAKALAARWKESDKHQSLEFWKWYFNLVRKSQWHLGVNERGWQANLEWLVKQRNFVNMIEKNRG